MSCPKPNVSKSFLFCLCLDIFQEEGGGGGLPNSDFFLKLFCLSLDIFQEGGVHYGPF